MNTVIAQNSQQNIKSKSDYHQQLSLISKQHHVTKINNFKSSANHNGNGSMSLLASSTHKMVNGKFNHRQHHNSSKSNNINNQQSEQQQLHINGNDDDSSNVIATNADDDAFFSSLDQYVVHDNDAISNNNNNLLESPTSETLIMIEPINNQQIRRPDDDNEENDDDDESYAPKTKIMKSSPLITESSSPSSLMMIDNDDVNNQISDMTTTTLMSGQPSFDYMLMDYDVENNNNGGGNDETNDDSNANINDEEVDFLKNLEVSDEDQDTKNVVDQLFMTTNSMENSEHQQSTTADLKAVLDTTTQVAADHVEIEKTWLKSDQIDCPQNKTIQTDSNESLSAHMTAQTTMSPMKETSVTTKSNKIKIEQSDNNKNSSGIQSIISSSSPSSMSENLTNSTDNHKPSEIGNNSGNHKQSFANKQQQINSSSTTMLTTTTTTNTSSTTSSSSSSSTTQASNYLSQDHDEIPRHTLCPLCDNTRSFCSSSSVTRHIRSVHKFSDLMDAKYCYCLLCQQFQEDVHSYFRHLELVHQFDLDKNFSLLFTKRTFTSIEGIKKFFFPI